MKIAISILGNSLESQFDYRFGRTSNFCIVDLETGASEIVVNTAFSASGGAGVEAAQLIAKHGAKAIISGAFGPNAYKTLAAAEIEMYLMPGGKSLTAAEVINVYKEGKLPKAEKATHKGHHGANR